MAVPTVIRKGLDIPLAGKPSGEVVTVPDPPVVALLPPEFDDLRPRLRVEEGDRVCRGAVLAEDKGHPDFRLTAPAGGRIRALRRGDRRVVEAIEIERDGAGEPEDFGSRSPGDVGRMQRDAVLALLLRSGYLGLLRQRPFGRIADPEVKPDSIFVNGMATAPYGADLNVAVRDAEAEFQAGLDALGRLTDGDVHLCLDADAADPSPALTAARGVKVHGFRGPHPAGTSSVHIHHIDPIRGGRKVWTVRGTDVLLIGHLLLRGQLPTHRVVALGGPGVRPEACRHYRVRIGAPVANLVRDRLQKDVDLRVIGGDALSGAVRDPAGFLGLGDASVTVLREDRERRFLGWALPGFRTFSVSRTFVSSWLGRRREQDLGTNRNGSRRAMVLTGLYDSVMPMRIRTDFLVRAVLAGDFDEAVKLGLLETVPEDFALCAFVCPSKIEVPDIIRQGLRELRAEEEAG